MSKNTAILRDGSVLEIGDEVVTKFPGCDGYTFVVCEINHYEHCESKARVVVHLKDDPSRKILGFKKENYHLNGPDGIDANWFVKVQQQLK